jgi:hypothetical protein
MLWGCSRSPEAELARSEAAWAKAFARQDEARAKAGLPALTEVKKALRHKFRGLLGGELVVDAFGEKVGVNIFDEKGQIFYKSAALSPRNQSQHAYGADFGVPVSLRAEWRVDGPEVNGVIQNPIYADVTQPGYVGGIVIGNYTAVVAERVSEVLLNDLRMKGGGFRLKIRLHDEGLLVGWDIARRVGYDPKMSERGVHFSEEYFNVEGDFHPARIYGGKVVTPGWYIHPRTKERIETDF